MKRAILRASFFSMNWSGSKFLTSAPIWQANADTSKLVMRSMPLLPASNACQTSSALLPTPQISPTPVTTTRRAKLVPFRMCVDVVDGILHGTNLLRLLVGNLDVEGFFKGHHQLNGVERIRSQVVDKRSVGGYLAFVHTQLLDDNLFYSFFNRCHEICKLLVVLPLALNSERIDGPLWRRYDFALACDSI